MEKIEDEKNKNNENKKEIESFEEMNLETNLVKGIYNCGFLKPSKI